MLASKLRTPEVWVSNLQWDDVENLFSVEFQFGSDDTAFVVDVDGDLQNTSFVPLRIIDDARTIAARLFGPKIARTWEHE
jgi:hypothetical protein